MTTSLNLPSTAEIDDAVNAIISYAQQQGLNPSNDELYGLRLQIMKLGQDMPIVIQALAATTSGTDALPAMPDAAKTKMFAEIRATIFISLVAAGVVFFLLQDMPKIGLPVALFIGLAPGVAAITRYFLARKKAKARSEVTS
ncbi:hypothetical protein [Thalassospira sp. MCCC 1A01428]|uniref:hypothetical protein n=1 Tax=Thalassospira sp. MCCC 1A01428 TaxID=1470575 RepID=UPI000A1FA663|nr:hypothetical protein [Thalassospira sp. MCCC 1A01428]OSQ39096.1 hypothetical protein THS27_21580 [Thalassospira sp. MCCC 1A01428]